LLADDEHDRDDDDDDVGHHHPADRDPEAQLAVRSVFPAGFFGLLLS
jgi:hypothetical protein